MSTVKGAGGSGKTRLAHELMNRVEEQWGCGFASRFDPPHALAQASAPVLQRDGPLLVVVDYAASHAEALRELLQDLARYGTPLSKLRLLLLERVADQNQGWYQRLFDYSQTSDTASLFYQGGEAEPISAVEEIARRREILRRTLEASARFHPVTPVPADDPIADHLLTPTQWGDPLVLMMAALASWDTGLFGALQLSRPDLAVRLAARERTRLEKGRSAPRLLTHLAAHSTLCGGLSREELLTAATEESQALGLQYPGGSGQLTAELEDVLPGRVILPDIVGEAFLLLVAAPGVDRAARRNGGATVKALVRTLQDFYDPYHARAMSTSGPSVNTSLAAQWIRELAQTARLELLLDLEANMPDSSLELREIAAEVTEKLIGLLRRIQRGQAAPELARLLNNQGVRLGELGRREEAEAAAREAVAIYRLLAQARPDAFLPGLAASLNNHGTMLSELGRREEAEAAAREAVAVYRQLAQARPDAFLPDLAMSLNNHGIRLSAMGRREEAEAAAREAVAVYRLLAQARPDAFLPNLAKSLGTLGSILSDPAAAANLVHEGIQTLRPLFVKLHAAYAPLMAKLCQTYIAKCQESGAAPDIELLTPIIAIFAKLKSGEPQ